MPRRSGIRGPRGNGPHGRGGRGGGGGGGSDAQSRETTISKVTSYVLRHGAAKEGVRLNENGYANVADLVWRFFLMEFTFVFFLLNRGCVSFGPMGICGKVIPLFLFFQSGAEKVGRLWFFPECMTICCYPLAFVHYSNSVS